MTTFAFQKATKKASRLRMALIGPSGGGKTYTALRIARAMFPDARIAVIDTERGSASKYADQFEFDTLELEIHSPQNYTEAIKAAEAAGYDVLIIDSLSHAWVGVEGAQEQKDKVVARAAARGGGRRNEFTAWAEVTPHHNRLVDTITGCRMHVFATMRSKTEYVMEEGRNGKTAPKKVGLAPVMRDGVEYEFDVTGYLDPSDNSLTVEKTRCPKLAGGFFVKAGEDVAEILKGWLTGEVVDEDAEAKQKAERRQDQRAVSKGEKPMSDSAKRLKHVVEVTGFARAKMPELAEDVLGRRPTTEEPLTDLDMDRLADELELRHSCEAGEVPF